ncbi:L-lactate permease [Rubrobacter marinus]|uniref:L-lactate permease n=1 Tax=Rubrobacter marinus TaxID=2653852 RepID=A0A6G8PU98_9ACTN|nr:lactate permease LctP family transporter [Rubrobacter marinus]QIN77923.1 L-lactate permease [Rubrobacter marinus]
MFQQFTHDYTPIGNVLVSALLAAIPIAVILVMLGVLRTKAHWAALGGLVSAFLVALLVYGMPLGIALSAAALGAVFGFWPIVWIVINALFLHNLTVETGKFDIVRNSLASLTTDRRIQALIIAFSFGALLEGIAGFGAPVAITAAIMASLGFNPLYAASIALLANTAPVAFGSLGVPVTTLGGLVAPIVGSDEGSATNALSAMIGRQLPIFSIIIPGFMVYVMAGWRGMMQVLPAVLTAGVTFAVTQFITANYLGPVLVDVLAALVSLAALYILLKIWQPQTAWRFEDEPDAEPIQAAPSAPGGRPAAGPTSGFAAGAPSVDPSGRGSGGTLQGFLPYIILVVFVVLSRIQTLIPSIEGTALDVTSYLSSFDVSIPWPGLNGLVTRVPPITTEPSPYEAVYSWQILSAAGTVVLFSAIIAGFVMGAGLGTQLRVYGRTLNQLKFAIVTIMMILALAYIMNYSGMTSTLGLAFAATGFLFPFFSALIGWLGVVLSGSDTSSNALFGPMQTITAQQVGVEPALAGATNSSGGVMGKMISPQNLSVGASAIGQEGREPDIFRMTFKWSIILVAAMGILAMFQAYVVPFIIPSLGGG